ncbi:MAG: aminodeoxychorismate/anthranilate synthase component II [Candidatus Omnitrophica bacterium]|nr:aminodeoxychorismate/anthranilate synthase component II [Candidatus Omnitrophota bacterium]
MVLVIDNYDSFTYNLVQYVEELGADTCVYRNDKITISQIEKINPERIIISPGPGRPDTLGGISCEVIAHFYKKVPILGVCLGHQCIGHFMGGKIVKAPKVMHGKVSLIYHNNKDIFRGIPNPFLATRYHSLVIERKNLPPNLIINAETDDGIIMGVKLKGYPLFGVQFHPESILTSEGKAILKNFLYL